MVYYAGLSRFESFVYQFQITGDIEEKLKRLDASMSIFTVSTPLSCLSSRCSQLALDAQVSANVQQARWNEEFSRASKADSNILEELLKNQEEIKNFTIAQMEIINKVLGGMQAVSRLEMVSPNCGSDLDWHASAFRIFGGKLHQGLNRKKQGTRSSQSRVLPTWACHKRIS